MALCCCSPCNCRLALAEDLRLIKDDSQNSVALAAAPGQQLTTIDHAEDDEDGNSGHVQCKLRCRSCGRGVGAATKTGIAGIVMDCFSCSKTRFIRSDKRKIATKKWKLATTELLAAGVLSITEEELCGNEKLPTMRGTPALRTAFVDEGLLNDETLQLLTQFDLRDYQLEMTRAALLTNSLICLPTGTGKTLIAAAVVHAMLRVNPQKMAVFVVNTVSLVEQQGRQLQQQIPHIKVVTAHGQMQDVEGQKHVAKIASTLQADVLVITCQLLNNYLDAEAVLRMCDICCLVLDEAHHATGNSPYATLMTKHYASGLYPEECRPLVTGMSASPVDSKEGIGGFLRFQEKLVQLMQTVQCKLCVPRGSDVSSCIPLLKTFSCLAPPSQREKHLKRDIDVYLKNIMRKVDQLSGDDVFGRVASSNSNQARVICRKKARELRYICNKGIANPHTENIAKVLLMLDHIQIVLQAQDINFVVGGATASRYLRDVFEEIGEGQRSGTPGQRAKYDLLHVEYRSLLNALIQDKRASKYGQEVMSSKCKRLVEVLSQFLDEKEAGRAIVFVRMRKTAQKLKTFLEMTQKRIRTELNPLVLVGHGVHGDGMQWEGQQDLVLESFRRGTTRLLIATNVLEEGIDVPTCSLVVRFDSNLFLRSLIQSRGRARASGAKFVLICSSTEQEEQLQEMLRMEEYAMQSMQNEMDNNSAQGHMGRFLAAHEHVELKVDLSTSPRGATPPADPLPDVAANDAPRWGVDDIDLDTLNDNWREVHGDEYTIGSDDEYEIGDDDIDYDEHALAAIAVFTNPVIRPEDTMTSRLQGTCVVMDWQQRKLHANEVICAIEQHEFLVRPPINASYADDRKQFERALLQNFFARELDDVWLQIRKSHCNRTSMLRLELAKVLMGSWLDHHQFISRTELAGAFRLSLDYSEREMTISVGDEHLLECSFWELQDFVVIHASADLRNVAIHLTLRHPPRLYMCLEAKGSNLQMRHRKVEIRENNEVLVDSDTLGGSLAYRLEFANPSCVESAFTPSMINCLKMLHSVGKSIWYAHVKITRLDGCFQTQEGGIPPDCRHHRDPDVNYAWCCLRSSPGFVMDRFKNEFFRELDVVSGPVVCEVLFRMAHDIGRSLFGNPMHLFKAAKKAFLKSPVLDGNIGRSHAKVRRMILTPTRMVFYEPDIIQVGGGGMKPCTCGQECIQHLQLMCSAQ